MSVAFKSAPFKTSGGTTARSLDAWFSDVINVAEFASLHEAPGTFGSGTGNDAPCFQAAFDLAFGSSSSPNGFTNRHLNRPVFIPQGRFRTTAPIVLTKVVGGHIYGMGKHSSQIHYEGVVSTGSLVPLLNMNGCSDLCIEKLFMQNHGNGGVMAGTNCCVINIDWDANNSGNGCDGNHDNHFQELQIGGGEFCIVIGSNAASQGDGNLFLNCSVNGGQVGYDVRGPNADNNQIVGGGGISCIVAWCRCPTGGGSINAQGMSLGGGDTGVEFLMQSNKVMVISQGRSENPKLLRMENGVVTVQGFTGTSGMIDAIEINGGKCIVQGNDIHDAGQIIGTGGQLYIQGTYFGTSVTPLSGYSGSVVVNHI